MENNKLFVTNLNFNTPLQKLVELCAGYGPVKDSYRPEGKGFAFITMQSGEDAKRIIDENCLFPKKVGLPERKALVPGPPDLHLPGKIDLASIPPLLLVVALQGKVEKMIAKRPPLKKKKILIKRLSKVQKLNRKKFEAELIEIAGLMI
jgi:hypothetical protein